MIRTVVAIGVVGALVLASVGLGVFQLRETGKARDALVESERRQEISSARIAAMEIQIRAEADRAQAVENDNAMLRRALEEARTARATAAAAAVPPITRDVVDARYRRGKELASTGEVEKALAEFLWCFDVGMRQINSMAGVRSSYLLAEIVRLGPTGIAALEDRRNRARQTLLAGSNDRRAASDFTSISRELNDRPAVLAIYDQMPSGDARKSVALSAFDQLVDARRYEDAMTGRTYASMISLFELQVQAAAPGRAHAIASAAKNIEVLAGAGELADASSLLARVLKHDSSETTKTLLQTHLKRAGHAELLEAPTR